MNAVEIITKKRDGKNLSKDEIRWMIHEYVRGEIPDYQMSALLMAIYFNGLESSETAALTEAMIQSGDRMDLSAVPGIKVDKHSTGGVGDKVSLVLAPLVAAAGVPVPMMSGRGLGHTGGTLDKLEAIPGFRTQLSEKEFRNILAKTGFAMIGQTESIVPADRLLYALRDVTGTVPSIPLICSSIISKKKAEGADALVLDVKVGNGAFLPDRSATVSLAKNLVRLGENVGLKTRALLTSMDQPLGLTVGNWLETREAIEALQGNGPDDLMEVTFQLGGLMCVLGGCAHSPSEGIKILKEKLDSGEGFEQFIRMTELQGGDVKVVESPDKYPHQAKAIEVTSPVSGTIIQMDTQIIGILSVSLGAGRMRKEDVVDPSAGIVLDKKIGDSVQTGERLATLYTNKSIASDELIQRYCKALIISDEEEPEFPQLIHELIEHG
ncbi:thymidine phosphorylase [candidate division KSB1 bacterium]|nr:thymidine phosphorylase [candidate division KSB1 bacterium]